MRPGSLHRGADSRRSHVFTPRQRLEGAAAGVLLRGSRSGTWGVRLGGGLGARPRLARGMGRSRLAAGADCAAAGAAMRRVGRQRAADSRTRRPRSGTSQGRGRQGSLPRGGRRRRLLDRGGDFDRSGGRFGCSRRGGFGLGDRSRGRRRRDGARFGRGRGRSRRWGRAHGGFHGRRRRCLGGRWRPRRRRCDAGSLGAGGLLVHKLPDPLHGWGIEAGQRVSLDVQPPFLDPLEQVLAFQA